MITEKKGLIIFAAIGLVFSLLLGSASLTRAINITSGLTPDEVDVSVNVLGGTNTPGDFTVLALSDNTTTTPSLSSFSGTAATTSVIFGDGNYSFVEATSSMPANYLDTYSPGCSGPITAGDMIINCTITDTFTGATSTPSTPTSTLSTDLSIAKTVDNASPMSGDNVTYMLVVSNFGPANGTGAVVQDMLPVGLSFVAASSSNGETYDTSSGQWVTGFFPSSANETFWLTANVGTTTATTTIINTATVTPPTGVTDSDISNNSSSVSIVVSPMAIPASTSSMPTSTTPSGPSGPSGPTIGVSSGGGGGGGGGSNGNGNGNGNVPPPFLVTTTSTGGQVLGASTSTVSTSTTGQVLGASIDCGVYLNKYLKHGKNNNIGQVVKLQEFLDGNLGLNLPATGFFGQKTFTAVEQFQTKYSSDVLAPWTAAGLASNNNPSGYVYKLTQWKINSLACPALDLPQPHIP
jgi:uncharacterized repeat protein (TIGR01451 family)